MITRELKTIRTGSGLRIAFACTVVSGKLEVKKNWRREVALLAIRGTSAVALFRT